LSINGKEERKAKTKQKLSPMIGSRNEEETIAKKCLLYLEKKLRDLFGEEVKEEVIGIVDIVSEVREMQEFFKERRDGGLIFEL